MQYCNISGIVAIQDDSFGPDTCFSSLHSERMKADLALSVALITNAFMPVMSLKSQESIKVRIQMIQ